MSSIRRASCRPDVRKATPCRIEYVSSLLLHFLQIINLHAVDFEVGDDGAEVLVAEFDDGEARSIVDFGFGT